MALVVDAGPLFAALDVTDRHHAACLSMIHSADEQLVIPSPALVEVAYWVEQELHTGVLVTLLDDIARDVYRVENLHAADYARVRDLCQQYADARVGFVDAAVLAVVERLEERKLATLDRRHFGLMRPRHIEALELLPA